MPETGIENHMGDTERETSPVEKPEDHLNRLLSPQDLDKPWFLTIGGAIKELINPPKRPPLKITSRPVDPKELKGLAGLYGGNEATSGVMSVMIHCGVVALLFWVGSLKPVQKIIKEQVTPLIAPNLKPYLPEKPKIAQGGGGGGAKQILDQSKGKLPKLAKEQFTPPRVDPVQNPKLPMTPTIVADNVPNILANNLGDPLSNLGLPSNGMGSGGGIGNGRGGGVGSGTGAGVGPGSGGGFGGGAYRIGGGVSAPSVLTKVEPEYSEEARKAKWQGTVLLSLVVDENGRAQNIKVVRSLGLGLDQKAIEAVEKWRFKPGMKDGKAVPVQASIEVNFRLL